MHPAPRLTEPSALRRRALPFLSGVVCLGLVGCGGDAPGPQDGAGPPITETSMGSMAVLPTWTTETVLSMGGPDAAPVHHFDQPVDVYRMDDGTVVVANSGTAEVRFYGPDGAPLATVAGAPGDSVGLAAPAWIDALPGDSLLVYDAATNHLVVLGPDRSVSRVASLQGAWTRPEYRGLLADGTVVMSDWPVTQPQGSQPTPQELRVFLHALDGSRVDTVGTFPHTVLVRSDDNRIGVPEFGPYTSVAASDDGMWVGLGRTYEVAYFGRAGGIQRIVRWAGPDRTVTQAHRDRLLEARLSTAGSETDRETVRRQHGAAVFASTLPAYGRIVAASDGEIWVEEYDPFGTDGGVTWTAFSAEGEALGQVTLEGRTALMDVGGGYITGLRQDGTATRVVVLRVER